MSEFGGTTAVANDYGAALQGLSGANIVQSSQEYNATAKYKINFTPYSVVEKAKVSILLQYPATISPSADVASRGCTVTTNLGTTNPSQCRKVQGAKLFNITDAIPAGYSGVVTINLEFKNPKDNWGTVGFKLKTYEVQKTATTYKKYLVDMLESNELIPNLKCLAPCFQCKEQGGTVIQKDFCVKCWQNKPQKYLMNYKPWNP